MSEERLQEIKDSLNAQYEIAKSDNKYQSVYVVLDEEQELIEEIERLNHLLEDIKIHLESYDYDNMSLDTRVLATNISLIINGVIKVVRNENNENVTNNDDLNNANISQLCGTADE